MVFGELSRVSRPCSPLDQEKVLKAGWLKRQRIIMKNWQLRWFVLKAEALYFYKDQDEIKEQGYIALKGSQVKELPTNRDEPGRHIFEIVPGGAAERDRNPEAFLLMANSESEAEEWVRAIKRAIWAPLGGGIFGQHLEETMLNEGQRGPQRKVPALVERCACFIRDQGLQEEGLFRAPGQSSRVRELQDTFDRGESLLFDSATDVHSVASLLKLYLRELPEPVIPFTQYAQFLSCALLLTKDREMGITELGKQVKSLPKVNYNLLEYICRFLDEVQSHSDANKMSVQNLATVFGPNVLRPRMEDPMTMMEGSSHVQHLMTVLISEHARLYQLENPDAVTENSLPHQKNSLHKGKVEWVKQEVAEPPAPSGTGVQIPQETPQPSTPAKDNKLIQTITYPERDEGVLANSKTEENGDSQANCKKEGRDSLTKQPSILSAWRYSFKGSSVGSRGNIGGSALDVSAGGSNWLMNGLSSLRAHRRTTSSGAKLKDSASSLKDSTLSLKETTVSVGDSRSEPDQDASRALHSQRAPHHSHRLSAYDNVGPSTLSLPAETSSIWTTFDISLEEPEDQRPLSDGTADVDHDQTCAADDVGTNVITELQQELKRQRMSFENTIRNLEETCRKHQAKVNILEEELDYERKLYHMLEIRFRNSERARQDGENRNLLLQREMEDFFQTLEDLTTKSS
ncbi:rho GTPase-activating protein 22 isoform X2 [Syngnathoides biaculeatus]|nr:rho GTPase-activating protein 22 isoform X2 [Syngnathoides biaculeatus]XP_061692391.1 rho GTPase-activating protein 22 isoform X2 [Syngnathoides biaculeatus]XP_061692392.1 rho GTPase-activating protein 22 isoform X2 [Syngnathoides biaculeatus]